MKKLKMLLILCVSLILSSVSVSAAFSDVESGIDFEEPAYRLSDLGIISGYTDGTFRPYDSVTRAQLAKMIVCVMDKEEVALNKGYSSRFADVADGYWAVPYINYAASQGILKGYVDGSFGPENTVTYAELSTIMLRMLKYDEESVGYNWPQNYYQKANSLGWNMGQNIDAYTPMSRALTTIIIDDALFTDVNPKYDGGADAAPAQGQSVITDCPLIGLYRDSVFEDVVVMASPADDSSLSYNEISVLDETGQTDGDVYISDITLKNYGSGTIFSHVVMDSDNNHLIAAKSYKSAQAGENALKELGYTILTDCHIISSSSYDRTMASGKVRTSKGDYDSNNANILSAVGEYGTIILNKNREVISYASHDADYAELVITDVDGDKVKYMENNELRTLNLGDDFPVYIDYGKKRNFKSAVKEFSGNSLLTLYSSNGNQSFDYGLLETTSGYTVYNDCFVAATKADDSSLATGQVKTSEGTFKLANTDIITQGGALGTLVLDENKKICGFAPTDMSKLSVTVNRISGDEIEYIGANGVKGNLTLDNNFVTYVDYLKTSYALSKSNISNGTDITLYGEVYGDWEFLVIDSSDKTTPVLASRNYAASADNLEGITINKDNLIVYRNGKTATLADIQKDDVVYYNTKTNIMDVYTKKITGIYYDAKPTKAYVTTVTVGGKDYTIGNIAATKKLDASTGAYEIGDRVTLLLGKNDEVVFVSDITGFSSMDYGVLLSCDTRLKGSGENTGTTEYVATLFMPDGSTAEYVTDKSYKSNVGNLVKIADGGGVVKLTSMSRETKSGGTIDKVNRTINGKKIIDDVVIIQRINDADGNIVSAEIVNFDTINASVMSDNQVRNIITANDFGDIGLLYVQDLTGSGYTYGILGSRTTNESTGNVEYNIYTGGKLTTFSASFNTNVAQGPVMFKYIVTPYYKITEIKALTKYAEASGYEAIDETRIKLKGTVYNIDVNTKIFKKTSTWEYEEKTFTDIKNESLTSVQIYSDVSQRNDGPIKMIVYTAK